MVGICRWLTSVRMLRGLRKAQEINDVKIVSVVVLAARAGKVWKGVRVL